LLGYLTVFSHNSIKSCFSVQKCLQPRTHFNCCILAACCSLESQLDFCVLCQCVHVNTNNVDRIWGGPPTHTQLEGWLSGDTTQPCLQWRREKWSILTADSSWGLEFPTVQGSVSGWCEKVLTPQRHYVWSQSMCAPQFIGRSRSVVRSKPIAGTCRGKAWASLVFL